MPRPKDWPSDFERFLQRIDINTPNGCWLWTAGRFDKGYGAFRVNGKQLKAHRWAYEHYIGPIPAGQLVCHSCDVPACVNPDHLFIGSHDDNMRDMTAKGRCNPIRGSRSRLARLTEEEVRAIRALADTGVYQREIGERYGISQGAVSMILAGRRWAEVA